MANGRRFTIGYLMAAIAVCALALAIRREGFLLVVFVGPLIGTVWDLRRGGNGLKGGMIGGVITLWFAGLVVYAITLYNGDGRFLVLLAIPNFLGLTLFGAALGAIEGSLVWLLVKVAAFLSSLVNMLNRQRSRVQRS